MIDSTFFQQSKTFSKLSCLGFQNLLYSKPFKNSDLLCVSKTQHDIKGQGNCQTMLVQILSKLSQFSQFVKMRSESIENDENGALEQKHIFRGCQGGDGLGLFKGCRVSCKYCLKAKTFPPSFKCK